MLKVFILLKFFLLLGGCAYKYTHEDNLDIEDVKKIKLNVKSFEINKNSLDIITTENLLQNEINKKVLNKLEAWAWKKFTVEGIESIAFLNLLKIDTSVIEKRRNKKSIFSINHQGKEVYKISLNFDLSINTNDSLIKTLKITSNLDFELLNKYSIAQRNKIINYNVNKLIKLIDKKVAFQLNNKAFNKFVTM
jgi:outer membrane lipopolysaccharide assembly protein LptE/RlpB